MMTSNYPIPFSSHRATLASHIDAANGPVVSPGDVQNTPVSDLNTKNALLAKLLTLNPESPDFAAVSQKLTEIREQLRKLEKVLEQENQNALERMKSFEKNNEAVFR